MAGGPWVKTFRGCGLAVGRKKGLFWGYRSSSFGGRYPTGMVSHPKEVSIGCDHLIYAIKVGNEEA